MDYFYVIDSYNYMCLIGYNDLFNIFKICVIVILSLLVFGFLVSVIRVEKCCLFLVILFSEIIVMMYLGLCLGFVFRDFFWISF